MLDYYKTSYMIIGEDLYEQDVSGAFDARTEE